MKKCLFTVVFCCLAVFWPHQAWAQTPASVSLSLQEVNPLSDHIRQFRVTFAIAAPRLMVSRLRLYTGDNSCNLDPGRTSARSIAIRGFPQTSQENACEQEYPLEHYRDREMSFYRIDSSYLFTDTLQVVVVEGSDPPLCFVFSYWPYQDTAGYEQWVWSRCFLPQDTVHENVPQLGIEQLPTDNPLSMRFIFSAQYAGPQPISLILRGATEGDTCALVVDSLLSILDASSFAAIGLHTCQESSQSLARDFNYQLPTTGLDQRDTMTFWFNEATTLCLRFGCFEGNLIETEIVLKERCYKPWVLTTSREEFYQKSEMQLYPNPLSISSGQSLQISGSQDAQVVGYVDVNGRFLAEQPKTPGLYVVQIKTTECVLGRKVIFTK